MFRRRTRSHSRDSGVSLPSDNVEEELINIDNDSEQQPIPVGQVEDRVEQEDREVGPDQAYDPGLIFTQGHPIGSVLLKMTADLTKLAELAKLRDMSTNVNELCKAFHFGTRLERAKTHNTIMINNDELESRILSKELLAHRLESDVKCPSHFSSVPTLKDNPLKLNEVTKVFPRAQCFSGTHREGMMSISEFLNNLAGAQAQCNLSEGEFLTRMLYSSTGLAHDLISMWISNGCNAERIYSSLLIHFDKRPSPEDAKLKLYSYRVAKSDNLAKATGQITLLVGTAAKAVPSGASRISYIDLEGCQALIRALPEWSSIQVSNLYKQLSAKLGRTLTFNELDQALHTLRGNIDMDIAQNGIEGSRPKFQPSKFSNPGKFSSYSVEINNVDTIAGKTFPAQRARTETSFTPRPTIRPYSGPPRRPLRPRNYVQGSNSNFIPLPASRPAQGGGGAFSKFNTRPNGGRDRSNSRNRTFAARKPFDRVNKSTGSTGDKRCVLCGMNNHKAETCRMMRDDQGNIKAIIPGYGKCSKCPQRIQPRLHHPENLCPFRPNGPLAKRA